MKISIFTPSHNPQFLDRACESIRRQQNVNGLDIEWIVLLNNGAQWEPINTQWKWIKVLKDETGNKNIGYLKRLCCEMATGDVFLELDHDDELLPGALEYLASTIRFPDKPAFLYSATHEVNENVVAKTYGNDYGWEHATQNGLTYNIPFDITPRSLCEIFYAPNHFRAWTRVGYEKAGKHDPAMECGDDHDLMIRCYLAGLEFIGTTVPYYLQHFYGGNSQHGDRNARIQVQQAITRDKYLTQLVHEWCRRESFAMLDLGGAFGCPDGYFAVDLLEPENKRTPWIPHDVALNGVPEHAELKRLRDNFAGIGCIRAKDFLEHVHPHHVISVMNSIHRSLVPGGWLLSMTPSTDGRGAWQDPTHVSFWNENSFLYYTSQHQAKYVPQITARFQALHCSTFFPGEWEKERNIPYVQFNGSALHGQRQPGPIGFPRLVK